LLGYGKNHFRVGAAPFKMQREVEMGQTNKKNEYGRHSTALK